ncbi:MAG TPA: G8 domain-containing protein [Gammaproteobacteria bacterium]
MLDAMRIQYRSFRLGLLFPALFLLGVSAEVDAQQADGALWSDPATWPSGKVPGEADQVTIGRDMNVVLDVSPPPLHGLTIDGKLSFANDADIELTTEWILLHGELAIGSESNPHTRKATITLTDNVPNENVSGMGDRGVMIVGGTLNLHGDRTNAWTKLAKTAEAGSNTIEVLNADGWRVGDVIVLASTDFDPYQAERRTISAINGNTITLDEKLDYMHYGKITFGVDERGEVGLLTRNILIQSSPDSEETLFGGHVMAMAGSKMYVSGVEFNRMGQHLHLARYPIHWHLVADAQGQYIENSAIHDTFSRCVTVHGTNFVRVENNVTYNNIGHCFFLEDGIEHGNEFVHNLGILTKCHMDKPCVPTDLGPFGVEGGTNFNTAGQDAEDILIPSDNTVSTFWITNPDNIYRDNVAAGSEATGFWFALPVHPTGAFEGTDVSKVTWPRRTQVREFKGNIAHSNFDGLMLDRGPQPDGHFRTGGHIAYADPADENGPLAEAVFEDFTAYKNRNGGIWARGEMHLFKNLKMADNAIGYTHASGNFGRSAYTSRVVDSLFVGETDNIGNPRTPAEMAYGRSLPQPKLPDFPIRGYEFYDYHHELDNVTFVNFADNDTRKTGAISYLLYTSFGMSSNNTIEGAKFTNAKPVYFPPLEFKWSNDDYGNGSYKTSVFHDLDGSVTGVPDSFVLVNDEANGIAIDTDACQIKPSWNAAVCTGDVGRLRVAGGGPGGPGGPGARRAGAGSSAPGSSGGPRGAAARPGGAGGQGGALAGVSFARGRFNEDGARGSGQPPIVLSRNGKDYSVSGETNVRAGTEIKVTTERPSLSLSVRELDEGSWVIFELPGFTTAASGTQVNSLRALRKASDTSYYKDDGSLWVKLVSSGDILGSGPNSGPGGGASLQVSR